MTSKEKVEMCIKILISAERVCGRLDDSELERLKLFEEILKDLERLEAIDKAKPNEALERLENLEKEKDFDVVSQNYDYHYLLSEEALETIKQALLKTQKQDKILEILKPYFKGAVFPSAINFNFSGENWKDIKEWLDNE